MITSCFHHAKIFISIFAILSALPQNSFAQQSEEAHDLAQLKTLNARFIHNFITNDTVSHGQIVSKDFICITSKGLHVSRKDYLTGWAKGYDANVMPYFDYRDERISYYGSFALVRAVTKFVVVKEGTETSGMTQYTDSYVKENGRWRCVQAQLTSVAPENYPSDNTIVRQYVKGVATPQYVITR